MAPDRSPDRSPDRPPVAPIPAPLSPADGARTGRRELERLPQKGGSAEGLLSGSDEEALAPPSTAIPCMTLRAYFRWAGFIAGLLIELVIHAKYGLSRTTFEAEEDCELGMGDLPSRCDILVFCEIVCRVCLTVVLSSMIWEFGRAVLHGAVWTCLKRTYAGSERSPDQTAVPTVLFSGAIAGLGIWCAVAEDDMPLWAMIACHVCDTFCHGIILSALLGIAHDLCSALRHGRLPRFLQHLLLCYDTIEAHGVTADAEDTTDSGSDAAAARSSGSSDDEGREAGAAGNAELEGENPDLEFEYELEANNCESAGECGDVRHPIGHKSVLKHQRKAKLPPQVESWRALFIWSAFLFTLWAAVMDSYFPDSTPEWASKFTKLEGCFCWAGIAWWLAQGFINCKSELGSLAGCNRRAQWQPS